jgi:flagella basal body P-ring formation protein FlgA
LTYNASELIVYSIEIRDITGRLIQLENTQTDTINIEALPAGVCFLTIKTAQGIVIKRFLKI